MKAILTDITKCIGCFECVAACKAAHGLPNDVPREWHRNDGLSAQNWTSIVSKPGSHYIRKQCRHCLEPACVSACPVAALVRTDTGAVIYEPSKCIGCRYCMIACPFGIPRYDWEKAVPYIQKCDMCYDRIIQGKQPACIEACPTQATIFGDRDEMLAEAHRRIKEEPDKYLDRVFGEKELGGLSVLYIGDIDLEFLSYPARSNTPVLPKTTTTAMNAVPPAFVGMGAVMGGLYWFCKRREKVQAETKKDEGAQ